MKTFIALIFAAALLTGAGTAAAGDGRDHLSALTPEQRENVLAQADIAAGELKALVQLCAQYGIVSPEEAGRIINGITAMTDRFRTGDTIPPRSALSAPAEGREFT